MVVIPRPVQRYSSVFLATVLALSIGCAGGGGRAESVDQSLGQADTTGSDAGRAVAIRFAVEVASDVSGPIYVLRNGADNQVGWVRAFKGRERVHFRERCEIEDCANPGIVCAAGFSVIENIATEARAGMIEYIWDGMTSVVDTSSGCETRRPAPPGDYTARFCYSHEAEFETGTDPTLGVLGKLIRPNCTERRFTLLDQEVVLKI